MSEAKKCDRCGKYYEKNVLFKTKGSICGSVLEGFATTEKNGRSDEWFDLCDNCLKSLFAWKARHANKSVWFPCEAGYPNDDREVLVTIKVRCKNQFAKIDKARYVLDTATGRCLWETLGHGIVGIGRIDPELEITAWMELPEPYKEDTQDE